MLLIKRYFKSVGHLAKYGKNPSKPFGDDLDMQKFCQSVTVESLFDNAIISKNRKSVKKSKQHDNKLSVPHLQVVGSEVSKSMILTVPCSKSTHTYYFNVAPGSIRQIVCNMTEKSQPFSSLLFTQLHSSKVLDELPTILNEQLIHDASTRHIYGPTGICDYLRSLCVFLFSTAAMSDFWPHLFIHDSNESFHRNNDGCLFVNTVSIHSTQDGELPLAAFICELADNDECHFKYVAVVDCPSESYITPILSNHHLAEFFVTDKPKLVLHLTPKAIYNTASYKQWIDEAQMSHHMNINDIEPDVMKPMICRHIFHRLSPTLFPTYQQKLCLNKQFNHHFLMKDAMLPLREEPSALRLKDVFNGIQLPNPEASNSIAECPKLVVLGSGNACVSPSRAPPCYLLYTSLTTSILLDCGDEAYPQMLRHYGKDKISSVLLTVKVVLISHSHNDHCVGLLTMAEKIVKTRLEHGICEPLIVLLPFELRRFIHSHTHKYSPLLKKSVDWYNVEILHGFHSKATMFAHVASELKIRALVPVKVDHTCPTYGVVVDHLHWKIVYSSDTLPMCAKLISAGKDADLLIHDCMYIDEKESLRKQNVKHSSLSGAVQTAAAMKAKNLLLTHFSHKCPVLPIKNLNSHSSFHGNLCYALDHMELSLNTVKLFADFHKSAVEVFGINGIF